MTTSCTDNNHPYYESITKLDTLKDVKNFFMEKDCFRMQYVSLGELLDFNSGGGMNYCFWEMSSKELTKFVNQLADTFEKMQY